MFFMNNKICQALQIMYEYAVNRGNTLRAVFVWFVLMLYQLSYSFLS